MERRSAVAAVEKKWERKSYSKLDMRLSCENVIRDRLRAPSTAKFGGGTTDNLVNVSGDLYTYKGYVDSQNGFGAMLRSDFSCTGGRYLPTVRVQMQDR